MEPEQELTINKVPYTHSSVPLEPHHMQQYADKYDPQKNGDFEEQFPPPPPVPPHEYETIEFQLHALETGFGFAIVGGANDGAAVSVHSVNQLFNLFYHISGCYMCLMVCLCQFSVYSQSFAGGSHTTETLYSVSDAFLDHGYNSSIGQVIPRIVS